MNGAEGFVRLRQACALCARHAAALAAAETAVRAQSLDPAALADPSSEVLRALDQLAYRFLRLQDDMGEKLFLRVLEALGEDAAGMPMVDRLRRLERLGWLPSEAEWMELRAMRNALAHEYPEDELRERVAQELLDAAARLRAIWEQFAGRIRERWGIACD